MAWYNPTVQTMFINRDRRYHLAYCVYCHTSPSGKRYVGVTSDCEKRFAHGRGYVHNELFWADICKYGWDAFKHEILFDGLSSEEAHQIEFELIHDWGLLDSSIGYNLWDGKSGRSVESAGRVSNSRIGNTNKLGRTPSDETKAKISRSLSAFYADHDGSFKGRHHTAETIEALRQRTFSPETRQKMRENHADFSGEKNPSARAVMQYGLDGTFIEEFPYASIASRKYSVDLSSIIKCCRGKAKTAGGYIWRYSPS